MGPGLSRAAKTGMTPGEERHASSAATQGCDTFARAFRALDASA
jgi:hypothetical protein